MNTNPISTSSDWTFDLIETYDREIGALAAEFGLDTYPKEVRDVLDTEVPKHIPLKRLGAEIDVAHAVVYLAGPAGDYVTGETLCVDGGQAHWGTVFPL